VNRKPESQPAINIALLGAAGRMGRTLMETARSYPGICISAALVPTASPLLGQDVGGLTYSAELEQALADSDVLVDFSSPAATSMAVDACVVARKPIIIGVTGLDEVLKKKITMAGQSIPVLAASNMSLGAVLLLQLAHAAAAALGEDFAVEITDHHHRHKKDAPSGTALVLGEAVASGRGVLLKEHAIFEFPGQSEPIQPGSIRFTSIRRGDIIGKHSVSFTDRAESLELTHRAQSRAAFARGALTAARWIVGKQAGLYSMVDVFGMHVQRN